MSAQPLKECPKCQGSLKRIIGTGSGPIFKGSGFYQTDYKGKSEQNKKSNNTDSKPSSAEKKVSKDDSK
jgi:predicted nucleic acid-binding Zn ribbon protein